MFAEGNRIVKYCVVVLNYLLGVSKNSQLPFMSSFYLGQSLDMSMSIKNPGGIGISNLNSKSTRDRSKRIYFKGPVGTRSKISRVFDGPC